MEASKPASSPLIPCETEPRTRPKDAKWSCSFRICVISVETSITWVISPKVFLSGAVQMSTLYGSPDLDVTTVSYCCDIPSSKVFTTGHSEQGISQQYE